jgi:hypothetical protein
MRRLKDLTGARFGKLTVIERAPSQKGHTCWKCRCDCGGEIIAQSWLLRRGDYRSCGCFRNELLRQRRTTHGMSHTRLFRIWAEMKKRCYNPKQGFYQDYGGRGITICKEWQSDFQAFYQWAIVSGYKDNLSIDRIDVNGNYTPDNCRWATRKEQANNTRRNHYVFYNGKTHTIAEWAEIIGISPKTIQSRLSSGWNIKDALNKPVRRCKKRKSSKGA